MAQVMTLAPAADAASERTLLTDETAAVAPERDGAVLPAADGPVAVSICGLAKRFGSLQAVAGLDLEIRRGETVALLGPNGAGKSTTIAMLLGLLQPDAGSVQVLGQQPRRAIAEGRVGAMLQDAGLMPGAHVGELLEFARSRYNRPLALSELVETADLAALLGRRVETLSGGQAQRVRFALAIAGNPALLVLDEPTAAMDVESRRAFWERMRLLAASGTTILFATHYLDEADLAADRVVIIARGTKVADGTTAQIKASIGERRIQFTLDGGADEPCRRWAGVRRVERFGRHVTLYSADADATVRALVRSGLAWRDLSIVAPDLEAAFLSVTGEAR